MTQDKLFDQIAIAQKNMAVDQREQYRKARERCQEIGYQMLMLGGAPLVDAINAIGSELNMPHLRDHLMSARSYQIVEFWGSRLMAVESVFSVKADMLHIAQWNIFVENVITVLDE